MMTPQNNKEGYEKTSVIKAAKDLHGRILLIHGMMDDNVHMQNTVAACERIAKAQQAIRPDALPDPAPRRHKPGSRSGICIR